MSLIQSLILILEWCHKTYEIVPTFYNCLICVACDFSPESAQTTSFTVQAGDIILLGTDGLFDNMKEEIILQRISQMKVGISAIIINNYGNCRARQNHLNYFAGRQNIEF